MTPKSHQEKVFRPEYAKELLHIAKGDLDSARALQKANVGRPENVCYHAHQVIEKCLKAVLVALSRAVPLVHDLSALIALMPEKSGFPFGYEISALNDFATVRRYEEGKSDLTREEIAAMLDVAEKIFHWAEKQVPK